MQKYFKSRRNDAIADQISDETHIYIYIHTHTHTHMIITIHINIYMYTYIPLMINLPPPETKKF